ncbi:MAG: 3-hexulose-6-phosphate synthase [Methanomassiliicoccales archaeon]
MDYKLQLALDFTIAKRAIQVAKEASRSGVDWIEAGTPLIKSEGMEIVRTLKREFPSHKIVADMKIADVGGMEVEIAAKAGADIVTIMGVSDDGTISEGVLSARQYGAEVMVDLISVHDKVKRAKEAEKMGASYLCVHVGVDQQMRGESPINELRAVSKAVGIPVAAAGGLNSETIPEIMDAGASIIIVGGAITKAQDPAAATAIIRRAMQEKKAYATPLFKKYGENELFDAFMKVSTPNIADAQHKKGAMVGIVPRIKHGTKMVGRALTVQTVNGDWAKPVEAVDRAEPGTVIVVDASGGHIAVWGELASWSAHVKGVHGIVIDGASRDIDSILDIPLPLFTRHIAPNAGEPKGFGQIGVEITCGGQTVRTGDWIIGDESGVVVVPQERAVEIANRAVDVMERENRIREEIKRGGTLSSVNELEKWEKVG